MNRKKLAPELELDASTHPMGSSTPQATWQVTLLEGAFVCVGHSSFTGNKFMPPTQVLHVRARDTTRVFSRQRFFSSILIAIQLSGDQRGAEIFGSSCCGGSWLPAHVCEQLPPPSSGMSHCYNSALAERLLPNHW